MNKLDTKFISLNRNLNHDLQTAQISCNLQSCEISSLNNKGKLVGITKPKFAFEQTMVLYFEAFFIPKLVNYACTIKVIEGEINQQNRADDSYIVPKFVPGTGKPPI